MEKIELIPNKMSIKGFHVGNTKECCCPDCCILRNEKQDMSTKGQKKNDLGVPRPKAPGRSTAAAGFAEPSRPPSRRNPIAITPIEAWAVVDPSGKIRWDCICDTKSSALFDMRWEFAWGRRNVGQVTNASCYKKGWSVARVCISAIGVEANSPQPKARTSSGKPGPKASPKTKSRK